MYKNEIIRRLNKVDYTRLPRILELPILVFDDVHATDDLKKMLHIADTNGMKYLEFYKLKEGVDVSLLLNRLVAIDYHPNIPFVEGQSGLSIAKVSITANGFDILANFYNLDDVWVKSADGRQQVLTPTQLRRVLHLKFDNSRLIIAIDPLGDGVLISQDIKAYMREIFGTYDINFNDYFEIMSLKTAIYTMVDADVLRPTRLKSEDASSNRVYDTLAKNPNDSLSDESVFTNTRTNALNIDRMKLKHDNLNVSIELYGNDLLKIWNKSSWEQMDGLKENITQLL